MGMADTAGGVRKTRARHPSISALLHRISLSELIIMSATTLVAIGVVMLFSLSIEAPRLSLSSKFTRHILFLVISIGASFCLYRIGVERLLNSYKILFAVSVLMLLAVFIPPFGGRIRGAARWLSFGALHFQPSELAKLATATLIAKFASEIQRNYIHFRAFLRKVLLPVGVVALLILAEPDFGSALFLVCTVAILLLVAGAHLKHILLSILIGLAVVSPIALVKLDYVRKRVSEFISEESDPVGVGYQPRQSLIALGSGGVFGCGLGASRQKLMFLPDRDTDFIFAIIGEEMGFCGTTAVLALFAIYFLCGISIAARMEDVELRVLVFAAAFIPTAQALLNVGVVTASLPTKGMTLPFVAFGGSALLINMLWVAVLLCGAKKVEGSLCER